MQSIDSQSCRRFSLALATGRRSAACRCRSCWPTKSFTTSFMLLCYPQAGQEWMNNILVLIPWLTRRANCCQTLHHQSRIFVGHLLPIIYGSLSPYTTTAQQRSSFWVKFSSVTRLMMSCSPRPRLSSDKISLWASILWEQHKSMNASFIYSRLTIHLASNLKVHDFSCRRTFLCQSLLILSVYVSGTTASDVEEYTDRYFQSQSESEFSETRFRYFVNTIQELSYFGCHENALSQTLYSLTQIYSNALTMLNFCNSQCQVRVISV